MENFTPEQKLKFLQGLNMFYRKILDSVYTPIGIVDQYNLSIISTLVSNAILNILEDINFL